MASGQDAHRGERPPRTARDASRGGLDVPAGHRATREAPGSKSGGGLAEILHTRWVKELCFPPCFFGAFGPKSDRTATPSDPALKPPQMRCKLSAWKRVRQGEKARQNAAQAVVFRQGAGFTR